MACPEGVVGSRKEARGPAFWERNRLDKTKMFLHPHSYIWEAVWNLVWDWRQMTFVYLFAIASFRDLRSLVVEMVLATDMSCHFEQIKVMKSLLQQPEAWVLPLPADAIPTCTHWNANKNIDLPILPANDSNELLCENMHINSKVCVAAF